MRGQTSRKRLRDRTHLALVSERLGWFGALSSIDDA
jgi:hypothetical protein